MAAAPFCHTRLHLVCVGEGMFAADYSNSAVFRPAVRLVCPGENNPGQEIKTGSIMGISRCSEVSPCVLHWSEHFSFSRRAEEKLGDKGGWENLTGGSKPLCLHAI